MPVSDWFMVRTKMIAGTASAILFALASPGLAGQKAHVHGEGQLNVALSGQDVEMELIAPGADIVGFEHAPSGDEDRAAIAKAVERLGDGMALFTFPAGAGCSMVEAEVEAPHSDEHGHDHKDEHGHDHKDEHAGQEQHAEFHAHYHFTCSDMTSLSHMDVQYFGQFPGAQTLEVQLIGDRGQSGAELTAAQNRLSF